MKEYLIAYVLGFLITGNIMATWFSTTIVEKVFSLFIKTGIPYPSYQNIIDKIEEKSHFFAELLSCPICLGHWISLFVAGCEVLILGLDPFYMLAAMFSWPVLAYRLFLKGD